MITEEINKLYTKKKAEKFSILLQKLLRKEILQEEFDLEIALNILRCMDTEPNEFFFHYYPEKPSGAEAMQGMDKTSIVYSNMAKDLQGNMEYKKYLVDKDKVRAKNASISHKYKTMHNTLKTYPEYVKKYIKRMQEFELLYFGEIKTL